jgi:hypothetical protein
MKRSVALRNVVNPNRIAGWGSPVPRGELGLDAGIRFAEA